MGFPREKLAFSSIVALAVLFLFIFSFYYYLRLYQTVVTINPSKAASSEIVSLVALDTTVKNKTISPQYDEVIWQMFRANESDRLRKYAEWEMSRPPTMTCKDRKRVGKDVGPLDQEPYSICFDKPFTPEPGKCLVYSFGIANEWDFDDEMATKYKCEVLAFDPSMNLEDNHRRQSGVVFYKVGISYEDGIYVPHNEIYGNKNPNVNWTMHTVRGTAKRFNHENRLIDVLKVDVEGAEVKSFLHALDDGFMKSNVVMVTLEWHLWNWLFNDPVGLINVLTVHRKLAESGFELFHSATRTTLNGFFPFESYVNRNIYK